MVLTSVGRGQFGLAPGSSLGLSTTATSSAQTRTVHGQVVNALTGAAIPRALVTLNSRQALTDPQGRFEFAQFADAQASVSVVKPGYSQGTDAAELYAPQRILDLSATVEVKLYPNAVITGTVAGQDGLSLTQIPIRVMRASFGGSGLRWLNAGFTMTNSRGEYRFTVPAGRYRVAVGYTPRSRDVQEAVMPVSVPQISSTNTLLSSITLSAGEEKLIDLRPRTGPADPVAIRVDGAGSRPNLRFTAVPASGETFSLNGSPGISQGEYRVELPTGSYVVHAQSDTREESLFGSGHVTVTGEEVASLTLHLAAATTLSIEVAVDPASGSQNGHADFSSVANVAQFGLSLHDVSGDGSSNPDISPRAREDRNFEFRVPPGRYRLSGNGGGLWYVQAATYGGITNLLTSDLVIAAGSAGEPMHLVASNVRGNVHGQVKLPSAVPTVWVYFFPRQPALAAPAPLSAGTDGSFVASLPVGSYFVAAFRSRIQEDLRDPETLERLLVGAKTVEVSTGTNPAVTLDLSQINEVPQ